MSAYLKLLRLHFPQKRVQLLLVSVVSVGDDDHNGENDPDAAQNANDYLSVGILLKAVLTLGKTNKPNILKSVSSSNVQAIKCSMQTKLLTANLGWLV